MVSLKNSFSRRYSNFCVSQPIKKLTNNVGFCVYSTPMDLIQFYIPFKGKKRPAKTKLMLAKLCAVLACAESDSTTESQMTEWKTGYNRKTNSAQSALARRVPRAGPACHPPHYTPTQGGCKIFVFVIERNFHKIFNFVFCKI